MVVKNDHKALWITIILLFVGALIGGACFFYWDEIEKIWGKETQHAPVIELLREEKELTVSGSISDLEGMNSNEYIDFTVKGTYKGIATVNYSLYLTKKDLNKNIKISLSKIVDGVETSIIKNVSIMYLSSYEEVNNLKVFHQDSINFNNEKSESETIYRLRAWTNEEIKETKISVGLSTKTLPNLEECFIVSENYITGYKCYKDNEYNMPVITDLIIPNEINNETILGIKENAFYDKDKDFGYNLTNVVIKDGLTIGENAFNNNNLKEIILPNDLTIIPNKAFYNNAIEAISIPDGVTTIGEEAFANNIITSLTIGKNVSSIKYHAFYNNSLTEVIIKGKNNLEDFNEIDMDAFGFMLGYGSKNIVFENNEE